MHGPKGTTREKRSTSGYTLIEVMVTLAIFLVGLLGLLGLQLSSIGNNSSAADLTVATRLAQEKIEEFTDQPYSSITETAGTSDPDNPLMDARGRIFNRSWIVDESGSEKTVTVRITWLGGEKVIEFSTVRTPYF